METRSDDEVLALIERARDGDRGAWERLYQLYEAELRRRVQSKLGGALRSELDTSDVLQSVWVESLRSVRNFEYRGDGSFLAWISAIVRHKIARKAGGARRRGEVKGEDAEWMAEALASGGAGPSTVLRDAEDKRLLRRALGELAPDQLEVLRLSWFEGLKHREVGEKLGVSEDAARMRVRRAETELEKAFRRLETGG